MNKLSFDQIKQHHEAVRASGSPNGQLSLSDFSTKMQQYDPDNDYSAGHSPDNMVGSWSRGLDSAIESTGLPEDVGNLTGNLGSGVDTLTGRQDQHYENIARDVGKGIPRMAGQVGAFIGGTAMLPTPAAPAGAALIGASLADAGAKGYTDSGGSVKQGVTSAAMLGLAPGIGSVGTKMGLKMLPKALQHSAAARVGAGLVGQEAAFTGAGAADFAINQGNILKDENNEFTMDNLFAQSIGSLAFSPLMARDAVAIARSTPKKPLSATQQRAQAAETEASRWRGNQDVMMKYLLAEPDVDLPNALKDKNLRQLLAETGMDPEGLSAVEQIQEIGKRRRAKALIQEGPVDVGERYASVHWTEKAAQKALEKAPEGSTIRKVGGEVEVSGRGKTRAVKSAQKGSEQWMVVGPDMKPVLEKAWRDLAGEAATLLRLDPQGLVPMVKQVQNVNKFRHLEKAGYESLDPEFGGERIPGQRGMPEMVHTSGGDVKPEGGAPKRVPKAVRAEQFELPGTEDATGGRATRLTTDDAPWGEMQPRLEGGNTLQDSEVFRFVKGPITHDGSRFFRIGNTDVSRRNGLINTNRFLKNTQMPKEVFELVKQVYPEAFSGDKVNVNKLRELEKTRPLLETHVYGQEGVVGDAKVQQDRILGELDALGIRVEMSNNGIEVDSFRNRRGESVDQDSEGVTPQQERLMDELISLGYKADDTFGDSPRATSYYNQISPFDTTKYPVVRVDVTANNKGYTESGREVPRPPKWQQDNLHENLPNTVGWAMVQFVPHPKTGETVMYVGEQQSRWGQEVAKSKAITKKTGAPLEPHHKNYNADHPLLSHQHKLVLKAAMDEARKRGVQKMVVSDGESAMMTERHDAVDNLDGAYPAPPENYRGTNAEWLVEQGARPTQEGGMRQHYDKVLQSAAEKMTRQKGEVVDMGVHKNATEDTTLDSLTGARSSYPNRSDAEAHVAQLGGTIREGAFGFVVEGSRVTKGSPVFRNPDGSPKTQATGKMYDIPAEVANNVRYSKLFYEPSGKDKEGFYTTDSLRAEVQRLNGIDGTPETAIARMYNKVKNSVKSAIGEVDPEITPALKVMSDVFDNLGMSKGLKKHWMKSTQKVLEELHVKGTKYSETAEGLLAHPEDAAKLRPGDVLAGAYFPRTKTVSVSRDTAGGGYVEQRAFHALSTLAHESIHNLIYRSDRAAFEGVDNYRINHVDSARKFATELQPAQRRELLENLYREMLPKEIRDAGGEQALRNWADYAHSTPEEFLVDYAGMLVLGKATAPQKRNMLRFVPEPLVDFVKAVFRGVHEMEKMLLPQAETVLPGLGKELQKFHGDLEAIYAKDPVMESAKQQVTDFVQGSSALEAGDYGGNGVQFKKVDIKALDERLGELNKIKQSNGFVRNMLQHAQISAGEFYRAHIPTYQSLVSALTTMDSMATRLNHTMRKSFMISVDGAALKELSNIPDSKLSPKQIQLKTTLGRVESAPKLQRKIFDSMLKTNELVKRAGITQEAYPTWDSPEVQSTLQGLSAQERSDASQVFHAYLEANKDAAALQVAAEHDTLRYAAADYLLGAGIPHDNAMELARGLTNAALNGDPRLMPPELAGNPGVDAFMKHFERVKPALDDFSRKMDRPYFTEFRSGTYGVKYDVLDAEGNVVDHGYRSTNNPTEWKAIQREVLDDPQNVITARINHKTDPRGRFGQMQTRGLEEATNLVRAHFEAAMENGDSEMAQRFQELGFDPAQPLVDQQKSLQGTQALRRLAPGREKINMIAAQDAYTGLIARKIANRAARLESNWLLKDSRWDQDKNLKLEMQKFRDSILSAGAQEYQNFRKFTTLMTMGGNVSSALVDSLQPISMGLWRATGEVGFKDALKYTAEGFAQAFKPLDRMSDKGYKEILIRAIDSGMLKTGGELDNIMSINDTVNYNVAKANSSRDLVDLSKYLTSREAMAGKAMEVFSDLQGKTMELAMTPMRTSAMLNNKNSLFVGYKMGLKEGLTGDALYNKAVEVMQTINLQGQRAAHSSFKTKFGRANGLAEAATLMTNYPVAVFGQLMSSWQGMLKSSGLSPEARKRSQQAFAGQVLTQMTMAGAAGMGFKGLFEIARQMFDIDPEDEIRKSLAAIDESGTLGEVVLNGVVNTVTGADLASRFDLSGIGGINPYTGFDAKGMFGAGGGMISALYNAPQQFAKGDISKIQLIPTGFRRAATAWGDDAYKDSSGQTIIDPTTKERFIQMIGFKPARMANVLEQKSTMRNIDQMTSERSTQRKAELFSLMQSGDQRKVEMMVEMDVQEIMQAPEYTSLEGRDRKTAKDRVTREYKLDLINYGVEKLLPYDPMGSGSKLAGMEKTASAESFGNYQTPRQSELARVSLKQQLMANSGVPMERRGRTRALHNAKLIDALIAENPEMTASQAKALVSGSRRR